MLPLVDLYDAVMESDENMEWGSLRVKLLTLAFPLSAYRLRVRSLSDSPDASLNASFLMVASIMPSFMRLTIIFELMSLSEMWYSLNRLGVRGLSYWL